MRARRLLLLALAAVMLAAVGSAACASGRAASPATSPTGIRHGGDAALAQAFRDHAHDVAVQGAGVVVRLLPDDSGGARHQRFFLRLASGQTLLIAHNIDIATRVPGLRLGDRIAFRGVYEWNPEGGTVHWTHHDPSGEHPGGWLRRAGRTYQ